MDGLIAAFARQQLQDMEQLQRDFGRKPRRARRTREAAAGATARVDRDSATTRRRPRAARSGSLAVLRRVLHLTRA